MDPNEIIIVTAVLITFLVVPAILAAHILFVNALHKWPRVRVDIGLKSFAVAAAFILALCWPIALVLACSKSLGSRIFASRSTRRGGDGNTCSSWAWYSSAWARIKTGCQRKSPKAEEHPVGYGEDVENQIAIQPLSKTQPNPDRAIRRQNTSMANNNTSDRRPNAPGTTNGMEIAQYSHQSCQTDPESSPPTYRMVMEEIVDATAIPDGRHPPPAYLA